MYSTHRSTGFLFRVTELFRALFTTRRSRGGTTFFSNVLLLVVLAATAWMLSIVVAPAAVSFLFAVKSGIEDLPQIMSAYADNGWLNGWDYVAAFDVVRKDAVVSVVLIVCAASWVLLVVYALYNARTRFKRTIFGTPKSLKSAEKGSATVETNAIVLASTTRTWRPGTPLKHAGLVLGYSPLLHLYYLSGESDHTQTIAPPDTGKTTRVVYPTIDAILASEDSAVVVDPKGEIFNNTYDDAVASGANVIVIDYSNWRRSNLYNCLSEITAVYQSNMEQYRATVEAAVDARLKGDMAAAGRLTLEARNYRIAALSRADALAADLAEGMIPDKEGNDQFWRPSARSLQRALSLHVSTYDESDYQGEGIAFSTPLRGQRSLKSLRNLLDLYGKPIKRQVGKSVEDYVPLEDLFAALDPDHPASKAFTQAKNSPNMTLGGIISTLLQVIDSIVDEETNMMSYATDFSFEDIGREKTIVYLIVPEESPAKFAYIPIFFTQAYQAFARLARKCGGQMPLLVHFVEEEKGSTPATARYANMLATGRGYGIRYHAILQNPYQWEEVYGDKTAKVIKPLFNTTAWLKFNDTDSAKAFSETVIGKHTVSVAQSGTSAPVGSLLTVMAGSTSNSTRNDAAELVPAAKLLAWDPLWGTFVTRTKLGRSGILNKLFFHRHEGNVALYPTAKPQHLPTFHAFGLNNRALAKEKALRAANIDKSADRIVVPPWDARGLSQAREAALAEMFSRGVLDAATQAAIDDAYWNRFAVPDAELAATSYFENYDGQDPDEFIAQACEFAASSVKRALTLANRLSQDIEIATGLNQPYSYMDESFINLRTQVRNKWFVAYRRRIEDLMEGVRFE